MDVSPVLSCWEKDNRCKEKKEIKISLTFRYGALLTAELAEQVENYYPTVSCQRPDRCWLFQASLSKWIPSDLADQLWKSGILA